MASRYVRAWTILVLGYAAGALALLTGMSRVLPAASGSGPSTLNAALGLAASVVALAVLTWFTAATGLALSRPERLLSAGAASGLVRRAAVLLLGVGLTGSLGPAPTYAVEKPAAAGAPATAGGVADRLQNWLPDRPATADLSGWTPDRPSTPPARGDVALVSTRARTGTWTDGDVVVRRGDSLWAIAARHLGPGADAAQIAAAWPRWYVANRERIGADPDLIVPGTRLRPPADA